VVERRLLEAADPGPLEDYFGLGPYAELRRLAEEANRRSVRGAPRVLILPGIMGSKLGIEIDGWFDDLVWIDPFELAMGGAGRLALPGEPKIGALGVLLFAYLALKFRLRREGFDARFHPFDWRRSVDDLGGRLAEAVEDGPERAHIVAHSMGGLVARAALRRRPGKLGSVVMLGTPNYGSFSAVEAFRGTHSVVRKIDFLDPTRSAETLAREVFGGFPGLLEMIPAPALFGLNLFDEAAWPRSGARPKQVALTKARRVRDGLQSDFPDLHLIVGVGRETIVGARIEEDEFVYESSQDGDGTVPVAAARLSSARSIHYVEEDHGALANNRAVAEAVASLLATGSTTVLPSDRERRPRAPRLVPERELRSPAFAGRLGGVGDRGPATGALGVSEQRSLVEEFAAPDRAPAPLMDIEKTGGARPPAAGGPTAFSDRVVIGRERQHRIEIALARGSITEADAPAYVLGLYRHVPPGGPARALDRRLGGAIGTMVERRMFNANLGEVSIVPTGRHPVRADMVAFVGLGPYDHFDESALAVVGENLVRTFATTRVDEFALVPFGGGSGRFTAAALERLLAGLFQGLRDADPERRFRGVTICETDPDRFFAIRDEVYRLSATALFDGIEVTLREVELPAPLEAEDARRSALPRASSVHLLVRKEPAREAGMVEFSASLLTSGARAAIRKDRVAFAEAELNELLAELHRLDGQGALADFGTRLAALVLPRSTRTSLAAFADEPLTVVHDADAAVVPWETLRFGDHVPAMRGGLTHRYEAENLSVAKWLDRRRMGPTVDVLLVVDPTEDLEGAEAEGRRVRALLERLSPAVTIRELRGAQARKTELLACLASGAFDVLHYAGHAFFDPRDPARSGLVCHGNEIVTGFDVASLGSLPSLVFFNACEAARIRAPREAPAEPKRSPDLPMRSRIERATGFAEAFLRGGVGNFIGTYWPVGDAAAGAFASVFYERLAAGETLHDALLKGRIAVYETGSIDWADYVFYGDPGFVLKPDAAERAKMAAGRLSRPATRDIGAQSVILCEGPCRDRSPEGIVSINDTESVRLGQLWPLNAGKHSFALDLRGERFRAKARVRAGHTIGDPQIISIEEPEP
jgi:pimeloyl-ACP methyl ester carboxylesterase